MRIARKPELDSKIIRGIIRGMRELHALGYVHTKLSLENILINIDPFEVKISNFLNAKLTMNVQKKNYDGSRLFYPMEG